MTSKLVEVLIMEGIAALLLWFAWMIGVRGKMELIAGYNEQSAKQVIDKRGLARLIARLCLLVAIASALMPLATTIWGQSLAGYWACMGAYGGFITGIIALTMLQARDYVEKS